MNHASIDTSFLDSVPFLVPEWEHIEFILVGCGGTGSHCAYAIARLMYAINLAGKISSATFVDFDIVEEKNILRQLFCPADLGFPKSQILAHRLSLNLGLNIAAINKPFDVGMINMSQGNGLNLIVVIGCVDNHQARISLAQTLDLNIPGMACRVLWIDGGNHEQSGQVLLGNTATAKDLSKYAFPANSGFCVGLPSPALIHPELLVEQQFSLTQSVSCAEQINAQSLSVNLRVAAEINDYLRGIVFGRLRRFATYFDLPSGSSSSIYITKTNVLI
jgi:PRTRC genetic system ThiF family protein